MPESISYYMRHGKEYAVLPLDIDELRGLIEYIPHYDAMRQEYEEALAHLEKRASRGSKPGGL